MADEEAHALCEKAAHTTISASETINTAYPSQGTMKPGTQRRDLSRVMPYVIQQDHGSLVIGYCRAQ